MERKIVFQPGCYYHIYTRGVERRVIFSDDNDKLRLQQLLYLSNGTQPLTFKRLRGEPLEKHVGDPPTSILAYSLMTNHIHLIAMEKNPGGISRFMGKLLTSYSMYFNTKYSRSGSLLGHPFRAKHIDNDDYLRWVMSYVHLNPLDLIEPGWKKKKLEDHAAATAFLHGYQFSSYLDYFGPQRVQNKIIDRAALPIDVSHLEKFEDMLKEFSNPFERPDLEIW